MKDTNSTTENITTNQEENVMNEELLEKKSNLQMISKAGMKIVT